MAKKLNQIEIEHEGRALAVAGEHLPAAPSGMDSNMALMEAQVVNAQRFPRSLVRFQSKVMELATMDQQSAVEMSYALPRGGKVIEGPSIRFAEVLYANWRNCLLDTWVEEVDRPNRVVKARAMFVDLETNMVRRTEEWRGIVDKYGNIYTDDMIRQTANAAKSIAARNAILAGIPRPAWRAAYEASRAVAIGKPHKGKISIPDKWRETVQAFAHYRVGPDMLLASLGVAHETGLTLDHISTLRGMWATLKNEEATPEEMFPNPSLAAPAESAGKKKKQTLDDLGAKGAHKEAAPAETQEDLDAAFDDGVRGYHKGLESIPKKYAGNKALSTAWLSGLQTAQSQSSEEERGARLDGSSEEE